MDEKNETSVLSTIQAARGFAAMAVVFAHATTILSFSQFLGYEPVWGLFRAGHAGVDFFFVLSGFIITTAHINDIQKPHLLANFIRKRAFRVYPIYWIANILLIAFIAIKLIAPPAQAITPHMIAANIFLLPDYFEPPLSAAWTLRYEVFFYATFALFILNRNFGIFVYFIWATWCLYCAVSYPVNLSPWAPHSLWIDFFGSTYNLQFCLGIFISLINRKYQIKNALWLATAGGIGFIVTCLLEDFGHIVFLGQIGRLLFGIFSGIAILGLANEERFRRIKVNQFLIKIGDASYAIYLIHLPVLFSLTHLIQPKSGSGLAWTLGLAIIAGTVGFIFHILIEKKISRWLRRNASKPRKYV